MMLPIGPYRPDLAETNAGVSRRVVNVNPRRDGSGVSYHPRRSFQIPATAEALPSEPRGGFAVVSRSGQFKGYFGTETALFELRPDYGYDEIGSGYVLPSQDQWGFCQYGDMLLASNGFDGLHAFNIEAGGAVTLIPAAPRAKMLFTAFECVFALDCNGNEYLMRNSAIGDFTNWSTRGAGGQEFPDGEALIGGGTLNDGTAAVLQRAAIHLLSVTGDARVYSKVKVADGIGAVSARSIVQAPGALYFLDSSGFYRLTSAGIDPIGQDKVNRTFVAELGQDALRTVEGAYDPERRQVAWRYKSEAVSSDTVFQNILIYDIAANEFVRVEETTTALLRMSSPALALEDLDQFGSLDELPYSLDSEAWKGGRPRLAALSDTFRFGFFDGPTLAARLDTATLTNAKSMRFRSVLPTTDAAGVTVSLGLRSRLADSPAWRPPVGTAASGRAPVSGRGKAATLRLQIPAGDLWTYARGVEEIEMTEGGGR